MHGVSITKHSSASRVNRLSRHVQSAAPVGHQTSSLNPLLYLKQWLERYRGQACITYVGTTYGHAYSTWHSPGHIDECGSSGVFSGNPDAYSWGPHLLHAFLPDPGCTPETYSFLRARFVNNGSYSLPLE